MAAEAGFRERFACGSEFESGPRGASRFLREVFMLGCLVLVVVGGVSKGTAALSKECFEDLMWLSRITRCLLRFMYHYVAKPDSPS